MLSHYGRSLALRAPTGLFFTFMLLLPIQCCFVLLVKPTTTTKRSEVLDPKVYIKLIIFIFIIENLNARIQIPGRLVWQPPMLRVTEILLHEYLHTKSNPRTPQDRVPSPLQSHIASATDMLTF